MQVEELKHALDESQSLVSKSNLKVNKLESEIKALKSTCTDGKKITSCSRRSSVSGNKYIVSKEVLIHRYIF